MELDSIRFSLEDANRFSLPAGPAGPYDLALKADGHHFILCVSPAVTGSEPATPPPVRKIEITRLALKRVLRDYALVCQSYFEAVRTMPPSQLEAIDMGRKSLHDEGAELLTELLQDQVEMDHDTARNLFSLLHLLFIASATAFLS